MVSSTPRPHFTPGKDPVPIVQEVGWAPGPVWTGGKSRPHRDSIPDRPVRSSVAIPTELPGPQLVYLGRFIIRTHHDARSRERQILKLCISSNNRLCKFRPILLHSATLRVAEPLFLRISQLIAQKTNKNT